MLKHLSPGNVIAAAVVIAFLMISSAVIELSQSRKELNQLMDKEASSLMKTILESSRNNILANDEIDNLIALRLLGTAKTVKRLDSAGAISGKLLYRIATDNSVYRINIFDGDGNKQFGSLLTDTLHSTSKHSPLDFIEPILKGEKEEIIIGLKEARHEEGKRFAVAIRRAENRKGAIVVNVDAEYMLQFKNKIGFERMIQGLGQSNGLKYIALQKNDKIIASSEQNRLDISRDDKDGFLSNAYNSDSLNSRIIKINNEEFFEVVQALAVNGEKLGLLRIAFNMEEMNSLESRMIRRAVVLSVILIIIGVTVLSILNIKQNLRIVSGQYKQIQTFSGNILQNMADAVITTDMSGNMRIFNESAEKLFRKRKPDIIGVNISGLLNKGLTAIADSLIKRKTLENIEMLYDDGAGTERTVNVTTTFTASQEGDYDSFTVVLKDLTRIKKGNYI